MKTLAKYAFLVVILFSSEYASCKHHHHHHHNHHQHQIVDEVVSVQLESQEQQELNLYKIQHLESQLSKTQNKLNMGTHESIIKAKKQAQDMTSSILDMVDDFTTQASTNTKTQNKQNLKDLIRMKQEMEKSFKILSEGRVAGIREVQKDVLGVTDEESDSLMDGIVTDDIAKTEEDPLAVVEPIVAPVDEQVKVLKKTKKKAKIEKVAPVEPAEEAPQEPAPEGDDPVEAAAAEPIVTITLDKKKKDKKVKKTIIPLAKITPPSSETPDTVDSDPLEDAKPDPDDEDLEAKKVADAEELKAKKAAAALLKKQNDNKKKGKANKNKKIKSQKAKEIQEQEEEVAKLDKELKRLEALAKKNQKAIAKKNKEASEQQKAKKSAHIKKEVAAKVAKNAKDKADKAKKLAKQKADKAAKLKKQHQAEEARIQEQEARMKAKADAAAAAAAELEAARQRVIQKEKARQAKIDKQEMEDITRLTGMPHQTYEEFSKDLLDGTAPDASSDDEFMKFLKKDDSDFDEGSSILPEFDYATSLSSKDSPKHDGIFGQDKIETYDQIQKQMQIIQKILPQIKDAGKRAGLVKHFAPKMEQAMNSLENKIQTESKKSAPKATVKKSPKKKIKVVKKVINKDQKVKFSRNDYSEIEKLAEKLSEEKFQKKIKEDKENKKASKSVKSKNNSDQANDLSKFDYQDEKSSSIKAVVPPQPQSVIQVSNKEDKEKLQKQENQIKDLEAKINALTNEKSSIEKQKQGQSNTDVILPKLETLAQKIENLEKLEKDRTSMDASNKDQVKKEIDFDKSKIVEVEKLAESMQTMIQQAQKQRKEMDSLQKEPTIKKVEKQNLTEKTSSDIKNHTETQGEISLSKKSPLKGSLDKPSTKGTISLLKKLI